MIEETLKKIFDKHEEILFAYLFGSMARGEAGKDSDVDIGIYIDEKKNIKPFYEIELAEEIERETNLKGVEIVILNGKSLRFLNQVLRYGKLIFSRDEKARILFETTVTKKYIDFKPYFEEYDKMRLKI